MRYKKKYNPSSRIWTSDLWISAIANYSPPLYQLSYRRCYNIPWKGLGLVIVIQGRHASDIYRDSCTNFLVWPVLYNIYLNASKVSPPFISGGVAQMVERSLSMREVPGSIPGASIPFWKNVYLVLNFFPAFFGLISPRFIQFPAKIMESKRLHRPGIEPGPPAWQASILPLNQRCPCLTRERSCFHSVSPWKCQNEMRILTAPNFLGGKKGQKEKRKNREKTS